MSSGDSADMQDAGVPSSQQQSAAQSPLRQLQREADAAAAVARAAVARSQEQKQAGSGGGAAGAAAAGAASARPPGRRPRPDDSNLVPAAASPEDALRGIEALGAAAYGPTVFIGALRDRVQSAMGAKLKEMSDLREAYSSALSRLENVQRLSDERAAEAAALLVQKTDRTKELEQVIQKVTTSAAQLTEIDELIKSKTAELEKIGATPQAAADQQMVALLDSLTELVSAIAPHEVANRGYERLAMSTFQARLDDPLYREFLQSPTAEAFEQKRIEMIAKETERQVKALEQKLQAPDIRGLSKDVIGKLNDLTKVAQDANKARIAATYSQAQAYAELSGASYGAAFESIRQLLAASAQNGKVKIDALLLDWNGKRLPTADIIYTYMKWRFAQEGLATQRVKAAFDQLVQQNFSSDAWRGAGFSSEDLQLFVTFLDTRVTTNEFPGMFRVRDIDRLQGVFRPRFETLTNVSFIPAAK